MSVMDLANKQGGEPASSGQPIRQATRADLQALSRLFTSADYHHFHLDFGSPLDQVGTPGFVVKPALSAGVGRLMGEWLAPMVRIQACLSVSADPPPAAWVRCAAVGGDPGPFEMLAAMLDAVIPVLQGQGVDQLGWLGAHRWPVPWLRQLGFQIDNQIQTYIKLDLELPDIAPIAGLSYRRARPEDLAPLAEIESRAYQPLWRLSAAGLGAALKAAPEFEVVHHHGRLIGYQVSDYSDLGPHLVRISIDPALHGQGFGSALLAHIISGYRAQHPSQISLNTQLDNLRSQHLYRKFGFQPVNQLAPVWVKEIPPAGTAGSG